MFWMLSLILDVNGKNENNKKDIADLPPMNQTDPHSFKSSCKISLPNVKVKLLNLCLIILSKGPTDV